MRQLCCVSKSGHRYLCPARELILRCALQVRAHVNAVKERLDRGLTVLAAVCLGNPPFTAERLESLSHLVTPLLDSPLVGEGSAFEAMLALARCLPEGLGRSALAISTSLRLVVLSQTFGEFLSDNDTS